MSTRVSTSLTFRFTNTLLVTDRRYGEQKYKQSIRTRFHKSLDEYKLKFVQKIMISTLSEFLHKYVIKHKSSPVNWAVLSNQ